VNSKTHGECHWEKHGPPPSRIARERARCAGMVTIDICPAPSTAVRRAAGGELRRQRGPVAVPVALTPSGEALPAGLVRPGRGI